MRIAIIMSLALIITGCGVTKSEPPPPKVIVKTERKVVVKKVKRDCKPIPSTEGIAYASKEFDDWVLNLIKLYKECAK